MQLEFRWFFWNSVLPRADFRNKSDYEGSNAFWKVTIAAMPYHENVLMLQCPHISHYESTHVSGPTCLMWFGHLFLRMSTCGNSRLLEGQGTSDWALLFWTISIGEWNTYHWFISESRAVHNFSSVSYSKGELNLGYSPRKWDSKNSESLLAIERLPCI